MTLRACTLIGVLLMPGIMPAQHLQFKNYNVSNGLLNGNVDSILQDHEGLLWIGTDTRLYRYDGRRFDEFGLNSGLPQTNINSLTEDSLHRLWVGTGSGVFVLIGDRFQPVTDQGRIIRIRLGQTIQAAPDGGVYLIENATILRAQVAESGIALAVQPAIPAQALSNARVQSISSLLALNRETLLFGCDHTVCRWSDSKLYRWANDNNLPSDQWSGLLQTKSGDIWARGERHVSTLPLGSENFLPRDPPNSGEKTIPSLIDKDRLDRVLVSVGSGIARWENGTWRIFGEDDGFPGAAQILLADREGSVWIGIAGHGLYKWTGYEAWETWTKKEGLASDVVWAIQRDPDGRLWLGHDNGVSVLNSLQRRFRTVPLPPAMHGERIQSLAMTARTSLWAGSAAGHLAYIDTANEKARQIPFEGGNIIRLRGDNHGRLWIAAEAGLYTVFPNELLPRKVTVSGGSTGWFQDVAVREDGTVYARSQSGMYCFDGETWKRIPVPARWLGSQFADIDIAKNGSLWLDGPIPGIAVLDTKKAQVTPQHFFERSAVQVNDLVLLAHDSRGHQWAGGANGVSVFDGTVWRPITQEDGLAWDDLNSKAFWEDRDGSLWFGTSQGLSHLIRPDLLFETQPLRLKLQSASFGEQSLAWTEPDWELPWAQVPLSFSLRVMSLRNEEATRVRYRLTGANGGWLDSKDGQITYSGLAPGSYSLQAFGIDLASGRRTATLNIDFHIQPPWWRSAWFLSCLALVIGVLIWLLLRCRTASLLQRQQKLELIVKERTLELDAKKVEAEQASLAKSRFLAVMSHEIRTPLNGVIGMAEILRRTDLAADQLECVNTIQGSGENLLAVVNDILDFSKIEAGRLVLDPVVFDPFKLLSQCLAIVRPTAEAKGVKLSLQSTGQQLPLVGDSLRLKQVILNLLSNAVKFTPSGGMVILEAGSQLLEDRAIFSVQVRDTGIGITDEQKAKLFQSFMQADASTTRRFGGTGLGLAISKQLIEQMRGEIGVDSIPGQGSNFFFSVPLPVADETQLSRAAAEENSGDTRVSSRQFDLEVLVADDNLINRKVAGHMLKNAGCRVTFAGNGTEAVALAVEKHFDLILMDCQMPEMDGFAATRAIRFSGTTVPIIALTANAMDDGPAQCFEAGMNDFLSKPFMPAQLVEKLDRWGVKHIIQR